MFRVQGLGFDWTLSRLYSTVQYTVHVTRISTLMTGMITNYDSYAYDSYDSYECL